MAKAKKSADETSTKAKAAKSSKVTGGKTEKASPEALAKRSQTIAAKARSAKASKQNTSKKGLADLFEHALADMYYAEKKIYKALPKMIKAANHPDLVAALTQHREETAVQIEGLEAIFVLLDKRAKAEKCDAIDGILEESESLLEDFGDSAAADAAIIFSCQAVEHYEITRYGSMSAFAEALGLNEAKAHLDTILAQEGAADRKLSEIAEGSINEAAAEYDEESSENA
ncbi:ferritin-like domain-containing protein (plasmid) [Paracoccus liaowanqingii]|uniref:Ferritin-like domain-containing protein n=1 Tax=Paracoccus liaowanqingii TaxID=2560053 RepID=A0A4Y5STN6_9RHOB|nr:ferritin-like domain-containing protein [Paracoccus liaowanqingii]QDA36877.1 ferritin-like domain-containing protein [Paracoccus liaowanqingii]